jgi:alkanesulfonate monooxygenase SsuD/methylene tetrahydromethanopterin reductase-like flavin-dependent oxidoreductase (luciferase family)
VHTVAPGATLVWAGLAALAPDAATADRRAQARTRPLPPDCVAGGPESVAAALAAYARAGADWVVVAPIDASNPDNVDVLAELVRPRLVATA